MCFYIQFYLQPNMYHQAKDHKVDILLAGILFFLKIISFYCTRCYLFSLSVCICVGLWPVSVFSVPSNSFLQQQILQESLQPQKHCWIPWGDLQSKNTHGQLTLHTNTFQFLRFSSNGFIIWHIKLLQ